MRKRRYSEFGALLRKYRKRADMSLTELARMVGVDRSHISKLEHGHERPSASLLYQLIRALDVGKVDASLMVRLCGFVPVCRCIEQVE